MASDTGACSTGMQVSLADHVRLGVGGKDGQQARNCGMGAGEGEQGSHSFQCAWTCPATQSREVRSWHDPRSNVLGLHDARVQAPRAPEPRWAYANHVATAPGVSPCSVLCNTTPWRSPPSRTPVRADRAAIIMTWNVLCTVRSSRRCAPGARSWGVRLVAVLRQRGESDHLGRTVRVVKLQLRGQHAASEFYRRHSLLTASPAGDLRLEGLGTTNPKHRNEGVVPLCIRASRSAAAVDLAPQCRIGKVWVHSSTGDVGQAHDAA